LLYSFQEVVLLIRNNADMSSNDSGTRAVIIMVKLGNELNITSASMIQIGNQTAVQLRSLVGGLSGQPSVLPQGVYYGLSSAYVVADASLEPSESCKVDIRVANNGEAFTKRFSFTTGSAGMLEQ